MATRRNLLSWRWRELLSVEDTVILTEVPLCLVTSTAAEQGKVALTRCIRLVLKERTCVYSYCQMKRPTLALLKQKYCNGFCVFLNHGSPLGFNVTKQQSQKQCKNKHFYTSSPEHSLMLRIAFCTKEGFLSPPSIQALHKQF